MSDIAIRVSGLSKKYLIGAKQVRQQRLYDLLSESMSAPFRRVKNSLSGQATGASELSEAIWALKDVTFEVGRGEVVGIIGRNGAGKSTLLKILSRITEPTEGFAEIFGRVGSLLEVGTGFHGDLTGRENVYLNGAILGMGRAEIDRKFDEIVAFSGIEKFVDTPVKHYSSGMQVRLAFSVAAHLEPEILLIDEVLAVGDAEFQKKCLGKMEDVAGEGRTVLFVSHNMSAIENLCSRGIYISKGRVKADISAAAAVDRYLGEVRLSTDNQPLHERADRTGNGLAKITGFYIKDRKGVVQEVLRSGEDYTFSLVYKLDGRVKPAKIDDVVASIAIKDSYDRIILLLRSNFTHHNVCLCAEEGAVHCTVRDLNLAQGIYSVTLFLSQHDVEILDLIDHAAQIHINGGDYFGTGKDGLPSLCKVLTRAEWSAE